MNPNGEALRIGLARPVDGFVWSTVYRVCTQEGREATYSDLMNESGGRWARGTIQNSVSHLTRMHRLNQYFSGCAFLTVNGLDIPTTKQVKLTSTGVPLLLRLLPQGQEQIHNVRLHVSAPGLYGGLIAKGWRPGAGNKDVALPPLRFHKERAVTVRVHDTDAVSVLVRSSKHPFHVGAVFELALLLDRVKDALEHEYLDRPARLPIVSCWTVKAWEHGLDGKHAFEGDSISMTFETWSGALSRFYAKDVGHGLRKLRLEVIESPGSSLDEALHQLLAQSERRPG